MAEMENLSGDVRRRRWKFIGQHLALMSIVPRFAYNGAPVFYLPVINLAICAISGLHEQ